MRIKIVTTLVFFLSVYHGFAQKKTNYSKGRAVLQGMVPPDYIKETIDLATVPMEVVSYTSDKYDTIVKRVINKRIKCVLSLDRPKYIKGDFFANGSKIGYHIESGDSIVVNYKGDEPIFSGRGAAKWELLYKLALLKDSMELTDSFKALSGRFKPLKNLNDYFAWNTYLNDKLRKTTELIDNYRSRMSDFAYNAIKERALYEIEEKRMVRFSYLSRGSVKSDSSDSLIVNQYGLTNRDLCVIFDSTMNGAGAQWLQYESSFVGDPYYLYAILKFYALRERNRFFKDRRSDTSILGKEEVDGYVVRYNLAKRRYKGLIREKVLAFFFNHEHGLLHELGFYPEIEEILADYYKQPGFENHKKEVRKYEVEERERQMGKRDVGFKLVDMYGNIFSKEDLKGKVVIMDFWFTGCKGCIQMVPALSKVEEAFKTDSDVVFLNVCVDESKDRWLQSVGQKKYTTGNGINLYTNGEGNEHSMIKNFGIAAYPSILLMDGYGHLVRGRSKIDPRIDNGRLLVNLIKEQLLLIKDGPYVWEGDSTIRISRINGISLMNETINKKQAVSFNVPSDTGGNSFTVKLKEQAHGTPCQFGDAEKILAISDIEGNLKALRDLLRSNGVIDENYDWTFGKGHLVLLGDVFDRGSQVTECLWLIYSLEQKAKEKGGFVHFILGNHEIMNLQGDNRYVHEKYKRNAAILNSSTSELYSNDAVLGKWLRTKNIIEKIGNLLFAHGGVSPGINKLKLSLEQINRIAREYYDRNGDALTDEYANVVMSSSQSPFWYRGYYTGQKNTGYIDSTLKIYSVSHIITGHTIVSDTVSMHHANKVINTDTRHADGKSEALLVEYGEFYRVNTQGKKTSLEVNSTLKKEEKYVFLK
ncbi:Thioredoxin-like [Chitinophaga filiformis]|uniref:Thioredoxin-like n=2 Tax=Chitinophaga filiformis TaxID=104663 RepID=A0A1G7UPC8_CHIFI|nr:Thioredoxin-like [Chitinophaga filiformis]